MYACNFQTHIISLPGKYGSDSFLPSYVMICTSFGNSAIKKQ